MFNVSERDGAVYVTGEEATLKAGRRKPSFQCSIKSTGEKVVVVGGGSGAGHGQELIIEACEYDRSFLNLKPKLAVLPTTVVETEAVLPTTVVSANVVHSCSFCW